MHTFRMLDTQADIDAILIPVLERNGIEVPPRGCFVAAVEMDEEGEVIAFQMLQNAIFFEGLWAKDSSANLRSLFHIALNHARSVLKVERVMTMTRDDDQGRRIGKLAQLLGFEPMNWNVFRRKPCQ